MAKMNDVLNDEQKAKLQEVKNNSRMNRRFNNNKEEKSFHPKKLENGLPYATQFYPKHLVKIALLIKNNAEFRRMLSLAIKQNLIVNGECKPEDKIYISYYWNKYSISVNGLKREEFYANEDFATCFGVANNLFTSYSISILENFLVNEFKKDIIDYDLVESYTSTLKSEIDKNVVEEDGREDRE